MKINIKIQITIIPDLATRLEIRNAYYETQGDGGERGGHKSKGQDPVCWDPGSPEEKSRNIKLFKVNGKEQNQIQLMLNSFGIHKNIQHYLHFLKLMKGKTTRK